MMTADAHSVNVKRVDLLAKLKENRTKHAEEYNLAKSAYRIEVLKKLKEESAKAEADITQFDKGLVIHLSPPPNNTASYDQVIAMMEMSVDETINLDSNSFNQYVLDQWNWKAAFAATTSGYIGNVVGAKR